MIKYIFFKVIKAILFSLINVFNVLKVVLYVFLSWNANIVQIFIIQKIQARYINLVKILVKNVKANQIIVFHVSQNTSQQIPITKDVQLVARYVKMFLFVYNVKKQDVILILIKFV